MRFRILTCLSLSLLPLLAGHITTVQATSITHTYSPSSYSTHASPLKTSSKHTAEEVIRQAYDMIGIPYVWGGATPRGFDCSGLVNYVFRHAGNVKLPRTANDIYRTSKQRVSRNQLQPGDLVFFKIKSRSRVDHIGIYVGQNRFVHAPRTGKNVRVSSLNSQYWKSHYLSASRVI